MGEDRREKIQTALAQTLDAETVTTAHEEIKLPDTALEALVKLGRCIELSRHLGVGCEVLKLIVSNDYEKFNRAANAIISAFRTKYEDEEKWQEKIEPFEDKIRSRKRDALTDYLIHSLELKVFGNLNDIYHYFLIDVELEGCARTSRVVAANSSVQLYVHRILMNLDQDRVGEIELCFKEEDAIEEWEWRKNYRVWEANRKVFLYPENYIEPDLRDNKTPLFEELESTLLQQEINEDTVLEAYVSYMRGFDEVANLKIVGSYHDIGDKTDFLHLFGVTVGDPIVYYYRVVENAYWSEKEPETHGIVWHPWQKIDVQIPLRKVSPIVFNGRLYAFWVEIVTTPKNEVVEGSSEFLGYGHKMSLKFSTLRPDGSWSSPQNITLSSKCGYPFYGEGVIYDMLDCITGIPEYDTSIHGEIQDGYTLHGFKWDQIYPEKCNNDRLLFWGAGFRFRSGIDFWKKLTVDTDPCYHNQDFNRSKILRARIEEDNFRKLYFIQLNESAFTFEDFSCCSILIEESRLIDLLEHPHRLSASRLEDYLSDSLYESNHLIAVLNSEDELSVINGSLNDCIIDSEGDLLLLQGSVRNGETYLIKRIGTTLSASMVNQLFTAGVDGLLDTQYQETYLREDRLPIEPNHGLVDCPKMSKKADTADPYLVMTKVDFEGPYGVYYREIFFHIPFLIANHLNSQQKFAEAQKWYHYIFNPTAKATGKESEPEDRNWRYIEFRKHEIESLREQLKDMDSIETYKKDPFNPHAIARLPLRFSAYQKSIVMKYIDNLLDWGDRLFKQDTMESINEATLLYVLASDILGERPAELGECGEVDAKTYDEISAVLDEQDNEFLIEMDHTVRSSSSGSDTYSYNYVPAPTWMNSATKNAHDHVTMRAFKTAGHHIGGIGPAVSGDIALTPRPTESMEISVDRDFRSKKEGIFRGSAWPKTKQEKIHPFVVAFANQIGPVFCIPENENLKSYWERVEDRLHKIRNCMNISGIRRELSLFAPEIDPMLLVRAKAVGLSIEDVLNSISGNLPPYRFSYLIERAKGSAAMLQGFGSALLSALEKKDIEELNLMHTVHQQNILKMSSHVREDEYAATLETVQSLKKRQQTIELRKLHYEELKKEGLISQEETQQNARNTAKGFEEASEIMHLVGALGFFIPQLGSPFAITFGGIQIGSYGEAFGQLLKSSAAIANTISASAGLEAGFKRREQGWQHQVNLADKELAEIEKQIEIAQIRSDIAEKLKDIHYKTVEQRQEVYELYRDKFTNLGLYTWLSTNLQRLFREAYNNAYAVAKLAEQAYRFERGDDSSELIGPNHWEASKTGLLAGERLLMDLQNLERKFLETNYRSLEIDQAFSLTQIDPAALIQLKETGTCEFEVPEIFFNLFYPGHYRRRIKAARLTIPCITGPYTNVSATLTLTGSQMRNEPKLGQEYLLDVPRSRSITIATSTAQNDAGVFELNFRDERYMPFEGAGDISKSQLSLPKNFRQFDYQTINDVILHISYTAEEDGTLRDEVEAQNGALEDTIQKFLREESLPRVFSFRQEFSNEFNRLLHSPAGDEVQIQISDKHFPIFLKGQNLNIKTAQLVLRTPEGQSVEGFDISINGDSQTSFVRATQFGELPTSESFASLFSTGILGEHTLVVNNSGYLAPDSLFPPDVSAIDSEKLTDIYLYLEYGIKRTSII